MLNFLGAFKGDLSIIGPRSLPMVSIAAFMFKLASFRAFRITRPSGLFAQSVAPVSRARIAVQPPHNRYAM